MPLSNEEISEFYSAESSWGHHFPARASATSSCEMFTQCSHGFVNIGTKYKREKTQLLSLFSFAIIREFPIFTIFTREHTIGEPCAKVGLLTVNIVNIGLMDRCDGSPSGRFAP